PKRRRVARQQSQPEPQGDPEPVAESQPEPVAESQPEPIHVAEPQPDSAPAAEEDDGEQLGEADIQEDGDTVQEGAAGKKAKKLEGPSWTGCIFGAADPAVFP
ncbi:hypothetical protein A2U01_0070473, partial [Trifolium medium]|nr:hypothetical protein [Trifolium medium]